MISDSLRSTFIRLAGATLAGAVLMGCSSGTELISYNREFRQHGIDQYKAGDYANAASSLQNALKSEPGDYWSRYYLGQTYEKLDKLQPAIGEYRVCLEVMSNSLEGKNDKNFRAFVVNALASAIAREPDHSGDLAILERQSKSAENAFIEAKVFRQTGDADSAIAKFDQAQLLDPNDPQIAKEYGLYLEQLNQTQRADAQLRRAYALNPKDEEVASALRRLGVVPGPSLAGEPGLVKPPIPLGPIPEIEVKTYDGRQSAGQPAQPANPGPVGSSNSPQD